MFEAIKYFSTEPSITRVLRHIHVVNLNHESTEIFSVIFNQLLGASEGGYESDVSSEGEHPTSRSPGYTHTHSSVGNTRDLTEDRPGKSTGTAGARKKANSKKGTGDPRSSTAKTGVRKDGDDRAPSTRKYQDKDNTETKGRSTAAKTKGISSSKSTGELSGRSAGSMGTTQREKAISASKSTVELSGRSSGSTGTKQREKTKPAPSSTSASSSVSRGSANDTEVLLQQYRQSKSSSQSRECQSLDPTMLSGGRELPKVTKKTVGSSTRTSGTSTRGRRAANLDGAERTDEVDSAAGGRPLRKEEEEEKCAICLERCLEPKKLSKCGHIFCTGCIVEYFETHGQKKCPVCGLVYGELRGDQPKGGSMRSEIDRGMRLAGHEDVPTFVMTFSFPSGRQGVINYQ